MMNVLREYICSHTISVGWPDPSPSPPAVQILSGTRRSVLVCVVSGLRAGPVLVSWRVNTTAPGPPETPPGPQLLWTQAHPAGTYRVSSVWTRSETDQSPSTSYCCGASLGPFPSRTLPAGKVLENLEPDLETCCHGACRDQT